MSKLIVFEGIDNSGKTSISRGVYEKLLEYTTTRSTEPVCYSGSDVTSWIWTKEPTFTTEEADRLNDPAMKVDENARELLFLESRLRQLPMYFSGNTVLDRYLWTGMAYAKVFSPSTFPFISLLYQNYNIFKKPTVTVFVDTPVAVCRSREPSLTIERLSSIREAYLAVQPMVQGPVIFTSGDGPLKETVESVFQQVLPYVQEIGL